MVDLEECLSIKNMDRLEAVKKNIMVNDRRRLTDLGVDVADESIVELHPGFKGSIGSNVRITARAKVYIGEYAAIPDNEVVSGERIF